MEKIINSAAYNTDHMISVASWNSKTEEIRETLYFTDCGKYLLHGIGTMAQMVNEYGMSSYNSEDLIALDEEDVVGWLKVHAPKRLEQLFPEELQATLALA